MFSIRFPTYIFLAQFIIFHKQCKFTMALVGPSVRQAVNNEFHGLVAIMSLQASNTTDIGTHQRCTGTLVSRQDVLTAEHCLQDTFTEGFKVLVGSIDLAEAIEYYPMFIMSYEHWILYMQRRLRGNEYHDMSVIKLLANIPSGVQFSPVGNIESHLLYGLNAQVIGWGRLVNGRKPRILQTATVKILTKTECRKQLFIFEGVNYNIGDKVLCTVGDPYAILGSGDSGGSLIFFGTTIGVSSGVAPVYGGTTQPNQINVHLNLRHYHGFIQHIITNFYMNL